MGSLTCAVEKQFADDKILLRPFRLHDATELFDAVHESISEIIPWMRWFDGDFSLAQSRDWIEYVQDAWQKKQAYIFAVVEQRTGKLLGSTWLSQIVHKHGYANVGYWVRSTGTGRGIATRAVRLLAGFGFGELKLKRLEILVGVGNRDSERVAEKIGAKREGILRQRLQLEGQGWDAIMFGLLAHEYAR